MPYMADSNRLVWKKPDKNDSAVKAATPLNAKALATPQGDAADNTVAAVSQVHLEEIRDWHIAKAHMTWSNETRERHEDFARWLNDTIDAL